MEPNEKQTRDSARKKQYLCSGDWFRSAGSKWGTTERVVLAAVSGCVMPRM